MERADGAITTGIRGGSQKDWTCRKPKPMSAGSASTWGLRRCGWMGSVRSMPVRAEGVIVTRSLISDGSRLVANAECGEDGYVDAEIVDSSDEVLPGSAGRTAIDSAATPCDTSSHGEGRG